MFASLNIQQLAIESTCPIQFLFKGFILFQHNVIGCKYSYL